jgi:hypothetical protein
VREAQGALESLRADHEGGVAARPSELPTLSASVIQSTTLRESAAATRLREFAPS